MFKLLPVLVAAILLSSVEHLNPALAGTCASKCGSPPIEFTPGQRVRVQVVNRTMSLIQLQKLYGTDPVPLTPGQELQLDQGDGTAPNISIVFWDATGLPLKVITAKPDDRTLRVEIRPGGRPPGDRSVYVLSDGRVAIF